MLSFDERMKLLESELDSVSSEDLLREIGGYESVGPTLGQFFRRTSYFPSIETNKSCNENSFVVHVTLLSKDDDFSSESMNETQAEAA
ncbi:hypothetical protein HGF60_11425 [Alteromonadaceae bacterium A_SAG2]|nr:hypothetical protein [Alteromonadaceae bacterium A_SAG2]|tara:strand:+ start:1138 stop:1401 length:264 start_codon:yes stop_codon:yes gene_type:complete